MKIIQTKIHGKSSNKESNYNYKAPKINSHIKCETARC